jgi:hypothetical protein
VFVTRAVQDIRTAPRDTLCEYAPTKSTLIAPPYEFAPEDNTVALLTALQLEQPESLTCTDTPLTLVASHVLLL